MSTPPHTTEAFSPFLSPRQLAELLGLSVTTLWRMRRRGEMPNPTKISAHRVGWSTSQIQSWLASRDEA